VDDFWLELTEAAEEAVKAIRIKRYWIGCTAFASAISAASCSKFLLEKQDLTDS
jgi:hypothetical protein